MKNKGSILIVDDDPAVRGVLEALLAEQGYDLIYASSGSEALEKGKESVPDLILLDVMMPDIDGFEICRRIRSAPPLGEVPVIMLTGLGDRDSRLRGLESGADDFLIKPFDRTELLARVRTITRLSRYRQLESKINRLLAVYDISGTLNSTIDLDALLEFIVQQTKEILDVEGTSILFYDQQKEELYFPIALVEKPGVEPKLKRIRFSIECGIAGWVVREEKPAIVQDASSDERFYGDVDGNTGFATRSVLCVPLHGKEGMLGVLEAVNKRNGNFTEDDRVLLEAMASNVSVSIEKANLHRDLEKAEAILKHQDRRSYQSAKQKCSFDDIIGNSYGIRDVISKAEQVALTDATVLIYGETGTGKEMFAQAIHNSSHRMFKNFVPVNCAAIPENLLESELFGHEKGAFTSATARRSGRFEEANNGTLFLDEIGDMPLNLQVKLLRALEEGFIRPLGSNQSVPVNVRVITATQKDLARMVADGEFRQDLYYRIKVFQLEIPSLRERREDIPLLIAYFIERYNKELNRQITGMEDKVRRILYQYNYPGNVRELQHIIESAMVISKGDMITVHVLPRELRNSAESDSGMSIGAENIAVPRNDEELKAAKAEAQWKIERLFLLKLLAGTRGNVSKAAKKANMNRSWLSQLVSKHQLDLSKFRVDED